MLRISLRLAVASLLALTALCDTVGIESQTVHLSSELDVGRELLKGCGSILVEAAVLCEGRKPFALHALLSSSCKSYYWCAPGRGACMLKCPQGTIFNAACRCCQDNSAHTVDLSTCSSSSSSSSSSKTSLAGARRKLLGADDEDISVAVVPVYTQTLQAQRSVAAALTAAGPPPADDSTIIYHAATGISTDSSGQPVPMPARRQGPQPPYGVWDSYGKHYSTGPFSGSNTVKEPAFGTPRQADSTAPSSGSSGSSSSSSGPVSIEIGSRTPPAPGAAAVAVASTPASTPPNALTEVDASAQALLAGLRASRQLFMKRLQPKAAPSNARSGVGAGAGMAAIADTPFTQLFAPHKAARALGPGDEVDVPFTTKDNGNTLHVRHRVSRMVKGNGMGGRDREIIEVGQLAGPEAEAARREAGLLPPSNVLRKIVPLPGNHAGSNTMVPLSAVYRRKRGGRGHTSGKKGRKSKQDRGRRSYDHSSLYIDAGKHDASTTAMLQKLMPQAFAGSSSSDGKARPALSRR